MARKSNEEIAAQHAQLRERTPAEIGAMCLAAGNVLSFERGMRVLRSNTYFLTTSKRLWSRCMDHPVYDFGPPSAA